MILIPIKWLFHWEYTLFPDKPIYIYIYYEASLGSGWSSASGLGELVDHTTEKALAPYAVKITGRTGGKVGRCWRLPVVNGWCFNWVMGQNPLSPFMTIFLVMDQPSMNQLRLRVPRAPGFWPKTIRPWPAHIEVRWSALSATSSQEAWRRPSSKLFAHCWCVEAAGKNWVHLGPSGSHGWGLTGVKPRVQKK